MAGRPQALFFLHIPKTAGTSVRYHLKEAFRPGEVFAPLTPGELDAGALAELKSKRFAAGHFPRGFAEGMPQSTCIFTLLRQPLARERSMQRMFRREAERYAAHDPFGDGIWDRYHTALEADPDAVTASDVHLDHFDNMQARMVAGGGWWDMTQSRRTGAALLKPAVAGLLQVEFGLVEHMDRSLLMLADTMGWPWRPVELTLNQGEPGPLSSGFEAAAAEANRIDLALYEVACELFDLRWRRFIERRLGADASQHPTGEVWDDLVAAVNARAAPPTGVSFLGAYPAGQGLQPEGFNPAFHYAGLDRPVRWLPLEATAVFHAPSPGQPLTLELEAWFPADWGAMSRFRATIDGAPAPVRAACDISVSPPLWRLAVDIPAGPKPRLRRLELAPPPDFAPSHENGAFCLGSVSLSA